MFCTSGHGLNFKKFCKVTAAAQPPTTLLAPPENSTVPHKLGHPYGKEPGAGVDPGCPCPRGTLKEEKSPPGLATAMPDPSGGAGGGRDIPGGPTREAGHTQCRVLFVLCCRRRAANPSGARARGAEGLRGRGAEGLRGRGAEGLKG